MSRVEVGWLARVVGILTFALVISGCLGEGKTSSDSSAVDSDDGSSSAADSGDDSSNSGAAGASASGGEPPAEDVDRECTIYHCDCSHCDFNIDYRCVENCEATCGNKEVGAHCNGSWASVIA